MTRKKGWKLAPEQRARQSTGAKKRWESASPQKRAEWVKSMGVADREWTDQSKQKISAAKRGKTLSPEHLVKCREASVRLWQDPEYRKMMSIKLNDPQIHAFKKTDQYRQNISEKARARWARLTKEERREATKNFQRAGLEAAATRHPTSIEAALYKSLDELKVEYEPQREIGWYMVDAFIPSLNLVVEADGQYWHSRPEAVARDKRKNTYLERKGYNLLRLTEAECRGDLTTLLRERLSISAA